MHFPKRFKCLGLEFFPMLHFVCKTICLLSEGPLKKKLFTTVKKKT